MLLIISITSQFQEYRLVFSDQKHLDMGNSCKSDHEKGGKRAPKGHFVVYAGEEMRRFVVPISYLKVPIFKQLLDEAAEEYGFQHSQGGIVLPNCHESTFQQALDFMAKY
ncbi:auxin-induced protein 15A-like [Rhododendron vialii]|uniref:auxin-induced protein 15A-like n=1 Tax=Rhododendron vialii TaxID=182163 RepID=UPI00265D722E|nr:auxin-induced protein 15A-like [Rhododendron vialii]